MARINSFKTLTIPFEMYYIIDNTKWQTYLWANQHLSSNVNDNLKYFVTNLRNQLVCYYIFSRNGQDYVKLMIFQDKS